MPPSSKSPSSLPEPGVAGLACFDADMKRLLRSYRTLEEDLSVFISTQVRLLACGEHPPEALASFR